MLTRRRLLGAAGLSLAASAIVRSQQPPSLGFTTIRDPDGWHPSLRLRGDWLVFEVSDGVHTGYGEASHSRDDDACRAAARRIFDAYYAGFEPTLASLRQREADIAPLAPDFVDATAFSGLNQAFYDLLAKREQVPVWRLFAERVAVESVPLYTTINRTLVTRTPDEYTQVAADVVARGFGGLKCAPFEAVANPSLGPSHSDAGLELLAGLREALPSLGLRVDCHERFRPEDFLTLVPRLAAASVRCSTSSTRHGCRSGSRRIIRRVRSRQPRVCMRLC